MLEANRQIYDQDSLAMSSINQRGHDTASTGLAALVGLTLIAGTIGALAYHYSNEEGNKEPVVKPPSLDLSIAPEGNSYFENRGGSLLIPREEAFNAVCSTNDPANPQVIMLVDFREIARAESRVTHHFAPRSIPAISPAHSIACQIDGTDARIYQPILLLDKSSKID